MFQISKHVEPQLLSGYLKRLGLSHEKPSLTYLNQLISRHQHTIPFENATRILDFHTPDKFVSLSAYLERISTTSTGGVCWSLARGFHWLLTQLNFDVHYLYMAPGHVCLSVQLDQPYYVDVGYGAPFFKAHPLRESFVVPAASETFDYQVQGESVLVTRTPGPTKTLSLSPATPQLLQAEFERGNVWKQNRFLTQALVSCYFEERPVRLVGDELIDYRDSNPEKRILSKAEIEKTLIDTFSYDPRIYFEALKKLSE